MGHWPLGAGEVCYNPGEEASTQGFIDPLKYIWRQFNTHRPKTVPVASTKALNAGAEANGVFDGVEALKHH